MYLQYRAVIRHAVPLHALHTGFLNTLCKYEQKTLSGNKSEVLAQRLSRTHRHRTQKSHKRHAGEGSIFVLWPLSIIDLFPMLCALHCTCSRWRTVQYTHFPFLCQIRWSTISIRWHVYCAPLGCIYASEEYQFHCSNRKLVAWQEGKLARGWRMRLYAKCWDSERQGKAHRQGRRSTASTRQNVRSKMWKEDVSVEMENSGLSADRNVKTTLFKPLIFSKFVNWNQLFRNCAFKLSIHAEVGTASDDKEKIGHWWASNGQQIYILHVAAKSASARKMCTHCTLLKWSSAKTGENMNIIIGALPSESKTQAKKGA